jgi:hypothetical protein
MRVSEALNVFTHLIALSGFLALSITGEVSPFAIAVFSLSLTLSFVNGKYTKGYCLGGGVSSLLALLLIIYVGFSIVYLGAEIIKGLLDFLIYTQVLKLLGKKSTRDIMQIYVLSFFQFLAATVLTQSFYYGVVFLIYIAVSVWAIMVYSMRKDSLDHKSRAREDPRVVTPLFLSTTFIVSISIFFIAALIFLSVPRFKSGLFAGSFLNPRALRAGFSDEVMLGRVGEIKLDSSPVMRVRIVNRDGSALPGTLYWRGIALDEFDGIKWKSSDQDYEILRAGADGVFSIEHTERKLLYQEVITEHLDTDILFAAQKPLGFKAPWVRTITRMNDSYILSAARPGRMKYYAYSDTAIPARDKLRSDSTRYEEQIKRFLQLPESSKELKGLARDITKFDYNPYDKALSVKLYLLENFEYTRTLKEGSGASPLEDFLFEKKEGHCEYFATAMVILLREVGVPARIVNGFVGGEWNRHGEFYLVRESDAHSWAEVYFPSYGWVIFDSTPEADKGFHEARTSFALSYIDYLRFRWQRYVVDFSQKDQIRLLYGFEHSLRRQSVKLSNIRSINPSFDKLLSDFGSLLKSPCFCL